MNGPLESIINLWGPDNEDPEEFEYITEEIDTINDIEDIIELLVLSIVHGKPKIFGYLLDSIEYNEHVYDLIETTINTHANDKHIFLDSLRGYKQTKNFRRYSFN
jgi:hypothetical protein